MIEKKFVRGNKGLFLFLIFTIFSYTISHSQCINSIPTGDSVQNFCAVDKSTIGDLVTDISPNTTIAWFDSPKSTTPLSPSTYLQNGFTYYADNVYNDGCSPNRLAVTVIITGYPPQDVNVYVSKCSINEPTVASLPATGENIQWYDAEYNGNLLSPYAKLIDGQTYWVQQTVNGCTSRRLPTTVGLINPPAPTVPRYQDFCSTDAPTIADLQVEETNVVWYASSDSKAELSPETLLQNNQDYWAAQTAFPCESTERSITTVSIDTTPNAGTSNSYTECLENAVITDLFSLLGPDAETTGTWSGPSTLTGGYLGTFDPSVNTSGTYTYTVSTRMRICPDASADVVVNISNPDAPTTSQITQVFCEIDYLPGNATVADLNVDGTNIKWYDSLTATTPLNTTDALTNGVYYASQTNDLDCESVERLAVTVIISAPLAPTTSQENQLFCMIDYLPGNPTIADLNVEGNNIKWYDSENSTTELSLTDIIVNGATYYASQTNDLGCVSTERLAITVTVLNPSIATTTNTSQTFCEASNATVGNIQVSGNTIIWYDSETSTTPLNSDDLLVNGEYWALNTENGCESLERLMITVTVNTVTPPTIENTTQTFCASDLPTISDLETQTANIEWYATETTTTPLNPSDLLVNGNIYWAAAIDTSINCVSKTRVAVTAVVSDPGTPTISNNGNEFCLVNNPTLADLDDRVTSASNGTITWYTSYPNGSALNLSDLLIDNETYIAIETNSDGCSSTEPLYVTVDLDACSDADIVIYDGFSPTGDGINDTFVIKNLRYLYPDFSVEYFNRWGNKVYTANKNKPDWNGKLNGDGELVPAGVYYFIIHFNKDGKKPIQQTLYLSR